MRKTIVEKSEKERSICHGCHSWYSVRYVPGLLFIANGAYVSAGKTSVVSGRFP